MKLHIEYLVSVLILAFCAIAYSAPNLPSKALAIAKTTSKDDQRSTTAISSGAFISRDGYFLGFFAGARPPQEASIILATGETLTATIVSVKDGYLLLKAAVQIPQPGRLGKLHKNTKEVTFAGYAIENLSQGKLLPLLSKGRIINPNLRFGRTSSERLYVGTSASIQSGQNIVFAPDGKIIGIEAGINTRPSDDLSENYLSVFRPFTKSEIEQIESVISGTTRISGEND